jgi:hypothetical protein
MNLTPDEQGDTITMRDGRTRGADGFRYFILRTEVSVQREALPDVASEVGRALSELAHPFILEREQQHRVYGVDERQLPGAREAIENDGYEVEVIDDCAPFKVPGQEAAGQLVIRTGRDTLPSPSLEMEGDV